MKTRVAVQARQRLFRDGLAMYLEAEPDLEVVGTAATAAELTRLCEEQRPDVVVLEADATDWDACRLVAALRKRHRSQRVVGTYAAMDRAHAMRAYQAGFRTLIARTSGIAALVTAVRSHQVRGEIATIPRDEIVLTDPPGGLTSRELEVLQLVGSGLTTREISQKLEISPKTVENHKQRIFAKLGVQNQAHAVAIAMRRGMLSLNLALSISAGV
jgi:DNA-binding NarL/FixJ family response regulator